VVLILVVAAPLLGTLVIGQLFGSAVPRGALQKLVQMKPQRSFAPRLSIPTGYHPCAPAVAQGAGSVPRQACGSSDEGSLDLRGLADAGNSIDPDLLQASALAAIIWPDGTNDQALGDAIVRLQKALRLSPVRVPLLVDLAAAHMVRAEREQNARDLVAAIDYADEALALEPRNLAANYNSALAKQALGLDEEAERAWDAYLSIDSTSPWAGEARRRKRALITDSPEIHKPVPDASRADVATFVRLDPMEAREYGWQEVLGRWGAALEAGDTAQAASLLGLAEELARALEARPGGDASLADAVRSIRAVKPNRAATMALARAHRAYATGQGSLVALQGRAASNAFDRVIDARPASPVLLQWTTLSRAATKYQTGKVDQAVGDLRRLLAEVDSIRHPALMGRARRTLGAILLRVGGAGRAQYASAAKHFTRAGETHNEGDVLSLAGEAAYEEGDTVGAYQTLYRAQRTLRPYRRSSRLHNQLHGLARCAALDGMPHAALAILDEDLRIAKRLGAPVRVLDALQARARVRFSLGDAHGAELDLDSAYALAPRLPDDDQRQWAKAAMQLASPEGGSSGEMDAAVGSLSGNLLWLVPALNRRAEAHAAARDYATAIRDLETILTGVERRIRGPGDALQGPLLAQARSSFDRLVMLYLHQGRPVHGLRTLERGRLTFAPQRESEAPGEDRLAVPVGHVALEYAMIGDTMLTWAIRGDSLSVVSQRIDRDAFVLAVEQVGAALETTGAPIPTRALRHLYDLLIRPVQGRLGPAMTPLVILPDGEVAGVPFAALMDADRYLIEDHPLRFATTLSDASRLSPPRTRTRPALLVADPAFDAGAYPMLFPLDWARTEVDSLLAFYPSHMVLRGGLATRDAFVSGAQRASVIHYAGHAVFDDARPERSYLVLAGAGATGRLTAEAVSGLRLGGVRLVVLSACRTLRSREGRSGGFVGLSGALLTAGAGGVVGSLWQVSDELTGPLMRQFHAEFQESADPALALRDAQVTMLRSKDHRLNSPAVWAGFRYMGDHRP